MHPGRLTLGMGLGTGILLGPPGIRAYLTNWAETNSRNPTATIPEDQKLSPASIVPRISISSAPNPYVDFTIFGEYGFTSVTAVADTGHDKSFGYSRYTVGGIVNGIYPDDTIAFLMGAGVTHSTLVFEDYRASTPGFRFQVGLRRKINPRWFWEFLMGFDYIQKGSGKALNPERVLNPNGTYSIAQTNRELNLTYTQIFYSLTFYFQAIR